MKKEICLILFAFVLALSPTIAIEKLSLAMNRTSKNITSNYTFTFNYEGNAHTIIFKPQPESQNFLINEQSKKYGRNGNHKEAVFALQTMLKMNIAPDLAFDFLFPDFSSKLDKILSAIDQKPKNSKIIFTPNFSKPFFITQEKTGFVVNKNKLYKELLEKFIQSPIVNVNLHREKQDPAIKKVDNLEKTQLLSKFSTSIASSSDDRKSNVKLALKAFNGLIVNPNQTISFNQTTGRRTKEKGYKDAHIILDGLFVDGTGGGVCQSSTTLYNALLLADNVEILESNRHSMPVSYVKLGFDAMVAFGSSDLKFKNVGNSPLYIKTFANTKNEVVVEIYGEKTNGSLIKKRRTEILKDIKSKGDITKYDSKQEFNDLMDENGFYRQKASKDGVEVQTYLDYYKNDKLIETKKVRHTTYPPQQGIVYKGIPKPKVETLNETQNI